MIKKYQKKPVVIEAVQWDGTDKSLGEIVPCVMDILQSMLIERSTQQWDRG